MNIYHDHSKRYRFNKRNGRLQVINRSLSRKFRQIAHGIKRYPHTQDIKNKISKSLRKTWRTKKTKMGRRAMWNARTHLSKPIGAY